MTPRLCLLCHGSAESVFCSYCERAIQRLALPMSSRLAEVNGFLVETLFDWNAQMDQPLRLLLMKLKGGRAAEAFRFLANLMADGELWHRPEAVVVPAPSRHGGLDHALRLALFLAAHRRLPVVLPLLRGRNSVSQKSLSRQRRRSLHLERRPSFADGLKPYKEVIFVDDVITTGATARRAYERLGSPRHFRIWAIARRALM